MTITNSPYNVGEHQHSLSSRQPAYTWALLGYLPRARLQPAQHVDWLGGCRPSVHISGVSFSHDGRKLFASYTNEQVYSFSCKEHQRMAAYFEAPDPAAHATR